MKAAELAAILLQHPEAEVYIPQPLGVDGKEYYEPSLALTTLSDGFGTVLYINTHEAAARIVRANGSSATTVFKTPTTSGP